MPSLNLLSAAALATLLIANANAWANFDQSSDPQAFAIKNLRGNTVRQAHIRRDAAGQAPDKNDPSFEAQRYWWGDNAHNIPAYGKKPTTKEAPPGPTWALPPTTTDPKKLQKDHPWQDPEAD
ncbi:hypothetical protein DFS34DRAFT_646373 [Phlyctochytrium arcticum]|nr:hypothetical protein DFS34DRAFT_646373 [Phlyctochytrium arcticum]